MPDFQSNLSALVSKELAGDAEAIGMVIERLTDALGLAIAVSCRGNVSLADELLIGVDGYLAECIAQHAKLARFMAEAKSGFTGGDDGTV